MSILKYINVCQKQCLESRSIGTWTLMFDPYSWLISCNSCKHGWTTCNVNNWRIVRVYCVHEFYITCSLPEAFFGGNNCFIPWTYTCMTYVNVFFLYKVRIEISVESDTKWKLSVNLRINRPLYAPLRLLWKSTTLATSDMMLPYVGNFYIRGISWRCQKWAVSQLGSM